MFNFFKSKNNKKNNTSFRTKVKGTGKPFNIPAPDLQALYACSVQKTIADFVPYGNSDFTFDSVDGYDVKGAQSVYEPNMSGQEIIYTYFAKQGFIGFNNCSILAQDWLILKAISAPCEDAIATNYDVTIKDRDITDEDKKIIDEMKLISDDATRFNIKDICRKFAENKRKYGQALCIPIVEGVNRELPFNIDGIRPNSYKGMTVIEPEWVTPVLDTEATTNPTSSRFYQPTWFKLPNGELIHYTWFIFNVYGSLSDVLKPTYYFGGIPLPQLLYEQVYAAHKTAKEAPMLAQSKRLNYMEGNLNAYLFDESKLNKEIRLLSWLRNNWGWLFLKKDQSIGQLDTSLTDFDAVTMLGYQIVAAISGVIAPRLLETSPKGWQSNGSYEEDSYKKMQQGIQRLDFAPILDFHYRLLAKSKYNLDNRYSIVFDAIDTPSEKDIAEIREITSRCDLNYIQAGVISPEEVRGVLREDINSGYNALTEEMEGQEEDPFNEIEEGIGSSAISSGEMNSLLNGAQVSSMINIASAVSEGRMPHGTGINILKTAFGLSEEEAKAIIEQTDDNKNELTGGSSTEQSPFNQDEWKEDDHPRDDGGKFSTSNTKGSVEKSSLRDKIKNKDRKALELPKGEYAKVVHELNTNLSKEQRKQGSITKCIGNYRYTIINKGFNEYTVINKEKI